jgi:tryptophan synthase alpha chain
MISLESSLEHKRLQGSKLLVPYITGGLDDEWTDVLRAVVDAGADAVEIGVPFSDPMIDGPTVQEASQRSLDRGTTPLSVFSELRGIDLGVPTAVMTYYNVVHHAGPKRFAGWMVDAGVSGVILPDLCFEESDPWRSVADDLRLETVQLVAPSTPEDRAKKLCDASKGFVYAVGVMGTTGERANVQESALEIAKRLKLLSEKTILVGIGISNPEQASAVSEFADGVVVGSALVRRLLEGQGPKGAYGFVSELRSALDG